MAKGFNKVILMGNLTRDVELRTTTSGQSVANFSLAVSRSWRNQDGQQQDQTHQLCSVGQAGRDYLAICQKRRAAFGERPARPA